MPSLRLWAPFRRKRKKVGGEGEGKCERKRQRRTRLKVGGEGEGQGQGEGARKRQRRPRRSGSRRGSAAAGINGFMPPPLADPSVYLSTGCIFGRELGAGMERWFDRMLGWAEGHEPWLGFVEKEDGKWRQHRGDVITFNWFGANTEHEVLRRMLDSLHSLYARFPARKTTSGDTPMQSPQYWYNACHF
ncbi:hypothetical protein FPV67DRAFT_783034 [Lyophyllum atratum]|nr:hypothetical protein FPV67DRAFT_783034 [Lyophyllum atratum]